MTEDLKKRFQDFEVSPPPSVWRGIAKHLGEQGDNLLLKEMVLEAEIEPPAKSWEAISEAIGHNAPLIRPARSSMFRHLQQAAAVIGGIVLIGSFFLLNNKLKKTSVTAVSSDILQLDPATLSVSGALGKPFIARIKSGVPRASDLYASLRIKKKTVPAITRQPETAVVGELSERLIPEPTIPAKPIRNESGEIIQDLKVIRKPDTDYVSVTSPNGSQTKISAKFAHFLLYLNRDNDTDANEGVFHKSFLESLTWKARFRDWRTTLSQNTIIPTSTNFMDILELKDIILQHKDID